MAIAFVTQATGTNSGLTITVTIATPTAGNALICTVSYLAAGGSSVSGITGGGVTWAKAVSSFTNRDSEIWYGLNSSGSGTSVVVTLSATVTNSSRANVSQWSGMPTTGDPVLASGGNNGSSFVPTTATITPSAGTECLLIATSALNTVGGQSIDAGPTNSFTGMTTASLTVHNSAYLIVASASGSYSTDWTMSKSIAWDTTIAAFGVAGPAATSLLYAQPPIRYMLVR